MTQDNRWTQAAIEQMIDSAAEEACCSNCGAAEVYQHGSGLDAEWRCLSCFAEAAPAAQGPSPMDHWKRARVDPPAVAGLVEAATAARRFLWAKSNATEYRNLANQLSDALAAYDKEQG